MTKKPQSITNETPDVNETTATNGENAEKEIVKVTVAHGVWPMLADWLRCGSKIVIRNKGISATYGGGSFGQAGIGGNGSINPTVTSFKGF